MLKAVTEDGETRQGYTVRSYVKNKIRDTLLSFLLFFLLRQNLSLKHRLATRTKMASGSEVWLPSPDRD